MKGDIRIVFVSSVNSGKTGTVKEILRTHIDECEEKYPNLLGYEFFFSDDESELYGFEWLRDSAALLKHLELTADTLGQLSEVFQIKRIEVLGNPTPEPGEAFSSFNAKVLTHWHGFTR